MTIPPDSLVRCNKALGSDLGPVLNQALAGSGTIGRAPLALGTQPTSGDTVSIGTDVYEFLPSVDGEVADDDNIAVTIGADVAASRVNLVAAINGTAPVLHVSALNSEGLPARGRGTAPVVATNTTTPIIVKTAQWAGGPVVAAKPNLALAETFTAVGNVWTGVTNMNQTGSEAGGMGMASVTITAAMITATSIALEFPFPVVDVVLQVRTAAGVIRAVGADSVAKSGNLAVVTLAGGSAPNIQATDIVTVIAKF
jgi:hypothetical protein